MWVKREFQLRKAYLCKVYYYIRGCVVFNGHIKRAESELMAANEKALYFVKKIAAINTVLVPLLKPPFLTNKNFVWYLNVQNTLMGIYRVVLEHVTSLSE